jgi:hypothetical protein
MNLILDLLYLAITSIKICSSIVIFFQNFVQYWYTSIVIQLWKYEIAWIFYSVLDCFILEGSCYQLLKSILNRRSDYFTKKTSKQHRCPDTAQLQAKCHFTLILKYKYAHYWRSHCDCELFLYFNLCLIWQSLSSFTSISFLTNCIVYR